MTHPFLEQVKTLSGYQLFSVMKQAKEKGNETVFKACYERARQLNANKYGDWEQAKAVFEGLDFPDLPDQSRIVVKELTPINGYPVYAHLILTVKFEVKHEYLAMVNGKLNTCVFRWFTKDGKPYSELEENFARAFHLPSGESGGDSKPSPSGRWKR